MVGIDNDVILCYNTLKKKQEGIWKQKKFVNDPETKRGKYQ